MRTAILTYDQLALFELGCAVELFALPRPEFKHWYQTDVVSFDKKPLNATGGIELKTKHITSLDCYQMLVIPSWPATNSEVPKEIARHIKRFYANGGRLVSFCSGAFLLAEIGLLNDKTSTTHWRYADQFKQKYPKSYYVDDVLYVYDDRIGCSAGSAAAIDLGLEIIRHDFGHNTANQVARRLVIAAHRDGGQSQFIETPIINHPNHFAATLDWAVQHLNEPLTVNTLAAKACMSRRTFDRKFRSSLNMSPKEWLNQQRLFLARQLLENSQHSIDVIAQNAGFGNAINLRNNFRERFNISPSQHRKQFGATGL